MLNKSGHITKTRPTYKFPSLKNNRTIAARTSLVLDYCYHLEHDFDVVSYSENAKTIYLELCGSYTAFKPDFIVKTKAGSQAVSIGQHTQLTESVIAKITTAYRRQNVVFVRQFAEDIRKTPLLPNLRLLYRYARQIPTATEQLLIFEFFKFRRAAEFEEVCLFFREKDLNETMSYSLIFHNLLYVDLNKLLDGNSIVRPFARSQKI